MRAAPAAVQCVAAAPATSLARVTERGVGWGGAVRHPGSGPEGLLVRLPLPADRARQRPHPPPPPQRLGRA